MTTVKDTQGRPWQISMSAATISRIRETVTRNGKPFTIGHLETFTDDVITLQSDFITLARTIFAIVKPQAEVRGVDENDFLEAVHGDTFDELLKALIDETIAFLPPAVRPVAAHARQVVEEASNAAIDTAIGEIEHAFQPTA